MAITARFGNKAREDRAAPAVRTGTNDVLAERMHSALLLSLRRTIG